MQDGNLTKKLEELKIHFFLKSTKASLILSISLMPVTMVSNHRTIRRETLKGIETLTSFYPIVSHIKA